MTAIVGVLTAILLGIWASVAQAEPPPERDEDVLTRIMTDGTLSADWVAPSIRNRLTPDLVASVVDRIQAAGGALQSVEPAADRWEMRLERASMTVILTRDGDGLISGLWFNEPVPYDLTLAEAAAAIAALPGRTALLVMQGDRELSARNADADLLVGSAFKLAVLAAVRDAVARGDLGWDQVVTLDPLGRSLPTGALQDFPDGHPITVATLAVMMMAISDNTATDTLIALVGRERVEEVVGMAPLLTTVEFFKLKAQGDLYDRYLTADTEGRRAILAAVADLPLPSTTEVATGRNQHGWALSARLLCRLIGDVAEMDAVAVNPGSVAAEDWARVSYKGGSDSGVVNMTYWLQPADGEPFCVAATWNNDEVDEAAFGRLLGQLAKTLRQPTAEPEAAQ